MNEHLPSDFAHTASKASMPVCILLFFVRTYQYLFSPYFGTQCRFTPTCSHYAVDALNKYGAVKGSYLASRRVLRCHPWHAGGHDPLA